MQTWRDVDGLPPLPKDDPKESPEAEEEEAGGEEEDDDEATDSEPMPVARTRGQKKVAAATSSLSAHDEESEGEKTATSPKKRKSPSQLAEEKRCKRMKQTSILDVGVSPTRPLGKVMGIPESVGGGLKTLSVSK